MISLPVPEPGLEAAAAAATIEEAAGEESGGRGALRVLLGSGTGQAGVALFAVMVAISVWVLATYPANFGTARWSNPSVWADLPKNAPPAWTSRLGGGDGVPHQTQTLTTPTDTREIAAGAIRTYRFPFRYDAAQFPTALSVTVGGVEFAARPPAVLVTLVRPDAAEPLRLASVPLRGPRPGENSPYRRLFDAPQPVLLSREAGAADALRRFYAETYPGLAVPADLENRVAAGLFGRPAADGSGRIEPLHGDFALQVQAVVADPADTIAQVGATLGGTVYGVMGTDGIGRDLWEGLLYGFPVGLAIASLTAIFSTLIGASLGILSGYAGGKTDVVIQRGADIVANTPTLPLLIFLVAILGRNLWLIMLILVLFSWPGLTILVRSMVLQIRAGGLVEAARALGASRTRIMVRHVFPQTAPFIVAQMIFFAPGAILAEAGLSLLGLGDPSIPTWGQMLEAGFRTGAIYVGYWWWILPPGILIVVTALAFMLLALAMEPIVDPRLRRTSGR